ncbi:MAG: hypothetical protein WC250_01925 [Candidatus Paceibacterota bacterium]|jgi:DNA polymerase III delta subunit
MLLFLYGENKDKAREKARELMESLAKKRPEASLFKLETDGFDLAKLEELVLGQGLFSNKYIVFLDSLFEDAEIKEQVLKFYKEIGASENAFIWLEGKVDKATLTKLEKVAEKVQKFESGEGKARKFGLGGGQAVSLNDFNIFDLASVLARRDRRQLWLLYREAISKDFPPEEICGILFWKLKDLLTKGNSSFEKAEIKKMAEKLVSIYHDAHRGKLDFEISLEKFVLTV